MYRLLSRRSNIVGSLRPTSFSRGFAGCYRLNAPANRTPSFSNDHQPEFSQANEKTTNSSEEEMDRFRKIEVIKGIFQGTGFLMLIFGGFILYNDFGYYKTKFKNFINGNDIEEKKGEPVKAAKPAEYVKFKQLKDSDATPGVYLWGSNADGVVNPNDLKTKSYKFPTRLPFFDGILIKDLKTNISIEETKDYLNIYLDNGEINKDAVAQTYSSAFAIDCNGDLIQWGKGFNSKEPTPKYTLKGFNLVKGEFSNNMIYLMNNKNEILYIPINERAQKKIKSNKQYTKSSYLGWGGSDRQNIFIEKLDTSILGKQKVYDFKTGVNHLILLTNYHKAYVCATGLKDKFINKKNYGQFGLIEYSQFEAAPSPNELHEIFLLNNEIVSKKDPNTVPKRENKKHSKFIPREIVQIAVGNYHTLARDSIGNVYSFGKNTFGQLGFKVSYNSENIPIPKKIDFFSQYFNRLNMYPIITDIQCDSNSSFVTINTKNIQEMLQRNYSDDDNIDAETFYFAFGKGLYGQLGLDFYTHANAIPKKMSSSLHDMNEYDEETQKMKRITISDWTIGKNHTFVTLSNRDVLCFGNNKFGQLGNGKFINSPAPANTLNIIESKDGLKSNSAIKKSGLQIDNDDEEIINVTRFLQKVNNRLQLVDDKQFNFKDSRGKNVSKKLKQVIIAGNENSAIYYSEK
ncbi:Fmp25 protein [Saccharomycopsis crataegensis]|uniref:Fmp25 protein n=1 Tax=Saccharomycopsis crataegensis TaxID=43959 RepID=A0AAV5QRK7_9ASCO|nr:Fmp25 protein [Saccharomycopsis crataegensis]